MDIQNRTNQILEKICDLAFKQIEKDIQNYESKHFEIQKTNLQESTQQNSQREFDQTINDMVTQFLKNTSQSFVCGSKQYITHFFDQNFQNFNNKQQFKETNISTQIIKQENQNSEQQTQQLQNNLNLDSEEGSPKLLRKKNVQNNLFQSAEKQESFQQQNDDYLDMQIKQIQQDQQQNINYFSNENQQEIIDQQEQDAQENQQMDQIKFGNLNPKIQNQENPESQDESINKKDEENDYMQEDVSDDSDLSESDENYEYFNENFQEFGEFDKEIVQNACKNVKVLKEVFKCKSWDGQKWDNKESEELDIATVVELYEKSFEIAKDKYAEIYIQNLKQRQLLFQKFDENSQNYHNYIKKTYYELQDLKKRALQVCMGYLNISQTDLDSIVQMMQTDYNNEQYETIVCNNDTQFNEYVLEVWNKNNEKLSLTMDDYREYILQEIENIEEIMTSGKHQALLLNLLVNGQGNDVPGILTQILNDVTFSTSGQYWFQIYDDEIMEEIVINEDKELNEYFNQKEKVFGQLVQNVIDNFQNLSEDEKLQHKQQ